MYVIFVWIRFAVGFISSIHTQPYTLLTSSDGSHPKSESESARRARRSHANAVFHPSTPACILSTIHAWCSITHLHPLPSSSSSNSALTTQRRSRCLLFRMEMVFVAPFSFFVFVFLRRFSIPIKMKHQSGAKQSPPTVKYNPHRSTNTYVFL